MNTLLLTQIILAAAILVNAVLIVFVYSRNIRPLMNKVLVVQMAGILGWTGSIFINIWLESGLVEHFVFAFAAAALVSQLYFVYLYPGLERPKEPRLALLMNAALGFGSVFIVASFIPGAVFTDIDLTAAGYTIVHPGWLSAGYSLFVVVYIAAAIGILAYKRWMLPSRRLREQTAYLLYGFIVFFLTNLFTNSVLPVAFDIHFFNGIGPVFSVILVAFIVHNIYRYKFLEISSLIQRGFIYTVLLGLVVAVYLSLVALIGMVAQPTLQVTVLFAGAITTLIGIFTVPVIDAYLREATDRYFFTGRYNYSDVVQELSEALNRNIEVSKIRTCIETILIQALKASAVEVDVTSDPKNVKQTGDRLTQSPDGTVIVQLRDRRQLIGQLRVYPKRSGDLYTARDLKLLFTLSHHLSLSLMRANLYEQLQLYSKQLEQTVEARTAELRQAHANERDMVSNIAHGLQTPLTVMKSDLDRVRRVIDSPEQLDAFERSIGSISSFVYDLLHLSRLESGALQPSFDPLDLSELADDIASYFYVLANEQGVDFVHEIEQEIMVMGDRKQLEELLLVVLSNALKYQRTDTNKWVKLLLKTDAGQVLIKVEDNGIGIPTEALPYVFERFYRVRQNKMESPTGSGLGLAIAEAIVDRHKGNVTVSSTVGIGTVFLIKLPLAQTHY